MSETACGAKDSSTLKNKDFMMWEIFSDFVKYGFCEVSKLKEQVFDGEARV